jgi:hypothetical protein
MACDCKETKGIQAEFNHANAVVVGKVIAQEQVVVTDEGLVKSVSHATRQNGKLMMQFTLVIIEQLKGDFKTDTIHVYTGMGVADCGFGFEIGAVYLVYGIDGFYKNNIFTESHASLWTSICMRTKLADKSEIEKIRKIAKKESA